MTLKQIFPLENILCVYFHDILKRLLRRFVWMLHSCVCFDLLHFVSLSMNRAVEGNVVAYCHAYNEDKFSKVGRLVQMNLHYTLKLFL